MINIQSSPNPVGIMSDALFDKCTAAGLKVKDLKAAKGDAEKVKAAVAELLAAKAEYKASSGKDYVAPGAAKPEEKKKEGKKDSKKEKTDAKPEEKKDKKEKKEEAAPAALPPVYSAPKGMTFYPSTSSKSDNMKVLLLANQLNLVSGNVMKTESGLAPAVPRLPAVSDKQGAVVLFGANAICRYLAESNGNGVTPVEERLLDIEEFADVKALVQEVEKSLPEGSALVESVLFPALHGCKEVLGSKASKIVESTKASESYAAITKSLNGGLESLEGFDFKSAGLMDSLKLIFSHAIISAFPVSATVKAALIGKDTGDDKDKPQQYQNKSTVLNGMHIAILTRCANAKFGDFQCNNAMALGKMLRSVPGYSGT